MAKFLVALSISIIILIYFNYPFKSEGISFLIVLICLIVLSFAGAKCWSKGELQDESFEAVENEMDKKHQIDGSFKYVSDGFYFKNDKVSEFVKWDEIIEVNAFSIPAGRQSKHTGLEVITIDKQFEFGDKDTIGIEKFGDKLFENLTDWKLNAEFSRVNNYGLEKANLFKRNPAT